MAVKHLLLVFVTHINIDWRHNPLGFNVTDRVSPAHTTSPTHLAHRDFPDLPDLRGPLDLPWWCLSAEL